VAAPITVKGTSIAALGERGSLPIVQGKAVFHMTDPDTAVSPVNDHAKEDLLTVGPERTDFHTLVREKEMPAPSGLLIGSRARDPADSDMATDLFYATGKVTGHKR